MLQNKVQQALRNAKNRGEDEGGFTLIELLVVILIIGILAAIALPTFLGQSDKAKDSAAKSDVRNAVTQIESYLAEGPNAANSAGWLTTTNIPALTQFKLLKTPVAADSSAGGNYTVTAVSKAGDGTNHTYTITRSGSAPGGYTYTKSAAANGPWTSAE